MAAFLQIGHMFYKGVTISQTKDTAQHILDSVSADLQYASTDPNTGSGGSDPNTYSFMCIGNSRYTYMLGHEVNSSAENWNDSTKPWNFGLLHDNGGCDDPFNSTSTLNNPVELLGNMMRLSNFDVNGTSGLYNLDVYVAYGDDDVFNNAASTSPTCVDNLKSSEFCAVTSLSTTVSKNFNF